MSDGRKQAGVFARHRIDVLLTRSEDGEQPNQNLLLSAKSYLISIGSGNG